MKLLKNPYFIIGLLLAVLVSFYLYFKYLLSINMKAAENKNVQAFLGMIRKCEHGGKDSPEVYHTTYGGTYIADLSDHPYFTGAWKGKTLSDTMCANAGLGPGCKSTAHGAYQYTKGTWKEKALKLGLKDMSPANQDLAAIDDLRSFDLIELIEAGQIEQALKSKKLGARWASLPSATTKQNPKSIATALAYYKSSGGATV